MAPRVDEILVKSSKEPLATLAAPSVGTSPVQRGATNIMSSVAVSKKPQRSRSVIKKAYVRFDDYLDLNEENMRRSCKRIMNKLYCEPGKQAMTNNQTVNARVMLADPVKAAALLSAESNVCQPKSPPPTLEQQQLKSVEAPESANQSADHLKDRTTTIAIRPSHTSVASSELSLATSEPVVQPGTEKSYLRSQYERREKRQLELMRKMQRALTKQDELEGDDPGPQMVMNFNLINKSRRVEATASSDDDQAKFNQVDNGQTRAESTEDGANENIGHRQSQQHHDLVAKSHELSKRRFFEKLERRESMKKNLELLSTQSGGRSRATRGTIFERRQPKSLGLSGATTTDNGATRGLQLLNETKKQIFLDSRENLSAVAFHRRSSITNGADGHPLNMFSMQHSMVVTSRTPLILNSSGENMVDSAERANDRLGESSRPPSTILSTVASSAPPLPAKPKTTDDFATNELIGTRTLLPPSQRAAVQRYSESAGMNKSQGGDVHQLALIEYSRCRDAEVLSFPLDKSAFEIKVLPGFSGLGQQFDVYTSTSGLSTSGSLVVKQVDDSSTTTQFECNKTLLIDSASSSMPTPAPGREDEPMASAVASSDARFEHKEGADKAQSKESTDNNDATSRRNQETIKVQSSDNQYQLPGVGGTLVQEASSAVRHEEKVISESISREQVNQGDASELGDHDGAEMEKVAAATASARSESLQTTSKQADKNNSSASESRSPSICSVRQLAINKVACKSGNHECPEIKAAPTQSSSAGAADKGHEQRIDVSDKPTASTALEAGASSDAQAKQQVAPVASANTSDLASNVERAAAAVEAERGSDTVLLLEADALDAGTQADEQAAWSLQTIITNKADARDVLPEANARMLNRQIDSNASIAAAEPNEAARVLPPSDNSMGNEAAKKVASQVEMSDFGRDLARGLPAPSLKLQEIENHDQCGGCSLHPTAGLQKRHLSERPRPPPLVGHLEQARSQDGQSYANLSPNLLVLGRELYHSNETTHHDYASAHSKSSPPLSECENVHCDRSGNRCRQLIEPLYCKSAGRLRAMQMEHEESGRRLGRGAIDEDLRSSCSSSGFGASVSATSSSSSAESNSSTSSPQHRHHHSFREKNLDDCFGPSGTGRRPNLSLGPHKGDQIYDVVRLDGAARNLHMARESILGSTTAGDDDQSRMSRDTYAQLSQLVGPDEAYPRKVARPLLIENHGYASLVNCCQLDTRNSKDALRKMEFHSSVQYANLPNGKAQPPLDPLSTAQCKSAAPEYATVRASVQRASNDIGVSIHNRMHPAENKKQSTSLDDDERRASSGLSGAEDCDTSSNDRNDSLSSTYSGGFSKLPPARLIDRNFANTSDSSGPRVAAPDSCLGSESQQSGNRTRSLLKRFGSLVSRAFTTTTNESAEKSLAKLGPNASNATREDGADSKMASPGPTERAETHKETARASEAVKQKLTEEQGAQSLPVQADLVVLPRKRNQVLARNVNQHENGLRQNHAVAGSTKNHRGHRTSKSNRRSRSKLRGDRLSRSISINSDSGSSSSSKSSLGYLSLISTPGHTNRNKSSARCKDQALEKANVKRTSSLSEELESLMSPSEVAELQRSGKPTKTATSKWHPFRGTASKRYNAPGRTRISIDCVSPTEFVGQYESPEKASVKTNENTSRKSRSLLRWLAGHGVANSTHSLICNSPGSRADKLVAESTGYVEDAGCNSNRVVKTPMVAYEKPDRAVERKRSEVGKRHYQSMNGFLSLIDTSHASGDYKFEHLKTASSEFSADKRDYDVKEPVSLIYSRLQRDRLQATELKKNRRRCLRESTGDTDGHRLKTDGCRAEEAKGDSFQHHGLNPAKCQSLNIYQTLMRNYVGKHHHKRHHSRGRRSHHHYHHAPSNCHHKNCCKQTASGTGRHGQACASARCGEQCASDYSSGKSGSNEGRSYGDKTRVWGQLIKINKCDGSQVIELQRAPNKSWGFFVARGAINNIKGIFISRMHDNVTSSSLTGLLSIGDRILTIDDCPIEPDFDILSVNQMISKRSKIILRVKPFKC